MSLILYINGQRADLDSGQAIAQTRQVNDLNSLENRQASYTNKFSLPKTGNNLRILEHLTLTGNNSTVPYRKNECSLYSESGECFIYKGWAIISDGGDDFDAVIYDGIIDLYKNIENKSLADLDLSALTHDKTVNAVLQSWTTNLPYRYILADYNGKTSYDNANGPNNKVNIDYIVPSVSVAHLWEKIFLYAGATYSGAVFNTEGFKNLWMSYPKGVTTNENDQEVFASSSYIMYNDFFYWYSFWLNYATAETNLLVQTNNHKHMKVAQAGYYRLEVSGTMQINHPITLQYAKNAEAYNLPNAIPAFNTLKSQINSNEPFFCSVGIYLNANESVCMFFKHLTGNFRFNENSQISVRLIKSTPNSINFSAALADFSMRDFLSEIVHRFGLTMFKDKYRNHYEFLTLSEFLGGSDAADWSDKYVRKVSESYIYGNYAQQNWMRYNYNEKESSHNDGFIGIDNVNLPDSRDIIKSRIYSPEAGKVNYFGRQTNVYKLWDKEIVDEPGPGEEPYSYKSLDKRYYFLRSQIVSSNNGSIVLGSGTMGTEIYNIGSRCVEYFWKLSFTDIITEYYGPAKQLLDRSLIINAELYLTEADIAGFSFKKLYYFRQLGAYFIMNKINNYVPGKPVKCELVRVKMLTDAESALPQPSITITQVTRLNSHIMRVAFSLANFEVSGNDYLKFESSLDGVVWTERTQTLSGQSPRIIQVYQYGNYPYWRIKYNALGLVSNTYHMT